MFFVSVLFCSFLFYIPLFSILFYSRFRIRYEFRMKFSFVILDSFKFRYYYCNSGIRIHPNLRITILFIFLQNLIGNETSRTSGLITTPSKNKTQESFVFRDPVNLKPETARGRIQRKVISSEFAAVAIEGCKPRATVAAGSLFPF